MGGLVPFSLVLFLFVVFVPLATTSPGSSRRGELVVSWVGKLRSLGVNVCLYFFISLA